MDPLAHTLVGAALGRAVAGRDVPAAGWIGAIAANAPDWSELVLKPDLWPPRAGGEYLVFHRGITHSFVGAAVEAAVLTGLVGVLLRLWARRAMVPAPLWRWVATGVTTLVLWRGHDLAVWWVRLARVGCAAAGVVGWTRHWFGVAGRRRAAAYGLMVLAAYAAANAGGSLVAKAQIRAAAAQRFGPDARWAALTMVGRPLRWEGLSASPDSVAGRGWAVARHLDHPAVRAALITSQGRAIAQFARFLAAAVDSSNGGVRVSLWDVRYHAPGSGADGWATVQVPLR